jgi:hypothetical protein
MNRSYWMPLLLATLFASGCGDRAPRPEPPEIRFERVAAYRQACVSRILLTSAAEDLETLSEAARNVDAADPLGEFSRRATAAALTFAEAYHRHAELRALAYAQLDSAVNHAATAADSIRHLERASAFSSVRVPAEGTVEANVFISYQEGFGGLLGNPDHPCNWDIPF